MPLWLKGYIHLQTIIFSRNRNIREIREAMQKRIKLSCFCCWLWGWSWWWWKWWCRWWNVHFHSTRRDWHTSGIVSTTTGRGRMEFVWQATGNTVQQFTDIWLEQPVRGKGEVIAYSLGGRCVCIFMCLIVCSFVYLEFKHCFQPKWKPKIIEPSFF